MAWFKGSRRLFSALIAVALVYTLSSLLGGVLGLGEGFSKEKLYLVGMTALIASFTSKYVHQKIEGGRR